MSKACSETLLSCAHANSEYKTACVLETGAPFLKEERVEDAAAPQSNSKPDVFKAQNICLPTSLHNCTNTLLAWHQDPICMHGLSAKCDRFGPH